MQHRKLKTWVGIGGLFVAAQAAAQVTLYEREDFRGLFVAMAGLNEVMRRMLDWDHERPGDKYNFLQRRVKSVGGG